MMLEFPAFFSRILVYLDGIMSVAALDTRIIAPVSILIGAILNRRGPSTLVFCIF